MAANKAVQDYWSLVFVDDDRAPKVTAKYRKEMDKLIASKDGAELDSALSRLALERSAAVQEATKTSE